MLTCRGSLSNWHSSVVSGQDCSRVTAWAMGPRTLASTEEMKDEEGKEKAG